LKGLGEKFKSFEKRDRLPDHALDNRPVGQLVTFYVAEPSYQVQEEQKRNLHEDAAAFAKAELGQRNCR